ncbi:hypothetical protein BKI52_28975 [marine bacterium AO1-C]|nr:hypothetical protein BKI52_28975 [marine bacterium AO1-C]
MKWNTLYYVYEVLVVLVTLGIGWLWWSEPAIEAENYWPSYNTSLEQSIYRATLAAQASDSTLRADVRKQGSSREGVDRIGRAALLQQRTNQVMAIVETAKNRLKNLPKNAQRQTSNLMINQAMAYRIKDSLDRYVDWLTFEFRDLGLPKFEKLAKHDHRKDWYYPWESIQDFPKRYFKYTRPAEAITILNLQQAAVKRYESKVLKRLDAGSITSSCGFNKVEPGVFAPLNTLQVGDEYTADMFISASASKYYTRMTYNGRPITVKDGKGEVLFTARGKSKQYWKSGFIFRKRGTLKDTTITYTLPFEVLPK